MNSASSCRVPPLCRCHEEPMVRNGRQPGTGKRKWRCAVKNRARVRKWEKDTALGRYSVWRRSRVRFLRKAKERVVGQIEVLYGTES
ncbi:MAG: hypothetical protein KatS3mg015_2825 [Fimbriimonadales bacterium]|nr:MAG: hypothetical protein KatS3mg015_2825 [Fimbriimonadales bacterium]